MSTESNVDQTDREAVKDVYVRDFPVALLQRIKQAAEQQGVGTRDSVVLRWAAAQFGNSLKEEPQP